MRGRERWWDRQARRIDPLTQKRGPTYLATVEHAQKHLRESDAVLEIGCGGGGYTCDLAHCVAHITATDLSPGMIDVASRRASERGVENVDFVCTTAARFEGRPASYDAVLAFNVLHLVDSAERDLRRIHALLEPGGRLISTTACMGKLRSFVGIVISVASRVGLAPRVRFFTTRELETVIARAGFEVVESEMLNEPSRNHLVVARKV